MGSIDGIPLPFRDPAIMGGTAFRLVKPADQNFTYASAGGDIVTLKEQSNWAVVTSQKILSQRDLLETTVDAAQEALDIVALTRRDYLSIPSADVEHLIWRKVNSKTEVLVVNRAESFVKITTSIQTNAGTSSGPTTTIPAVAVPNWHVSMRYFRYSRMRNDLFVAYRDAFLAFESIISQISGKGSSESERNWYKRVCTILETQGIVFSDLVDLPSPDFIASFVDEQYIANRCALFHAKAGAAARIPGRVVDRELASKALARMEQLLVRAFSKLFSASCSVGLLTSAFCHNTVNRWNPVVLSVSDDNTPVGLIDTNVSPAGKKITDLNTVFQGTFGHTGFEFSFFGSIDVAKMQSAIVNTLAATATSPPAGLIGRDTIEQLDLTDADEFQFRLICSYSQAAVFPFHYSL